MILRPVLGRRRPLGFGGSGKAHGTACAVVRAADDDLCSGVHSGRSGGGPSCLALAAAQTGYQGAWLQRGRARGPVMGLGARATTHC